MADTSALQFLQLKTHPGSAYNDSATASKLNGSAEKMAVVFVVPEDCNITGMACYCTATTGTQPYYKMDIQGVNTANSLPDGVIKGSGYASTAGFQATAATREAHSFAGALPVTQGEILSGVLEYSSGSISGSYYARFTQKISLVHYNTFPYELYDQGGGYSADMDAWSPLTCTTDLGFDIGGIFNIGPANYALSTSGHRYCMRVSIPATENLEMHVDGFRWNGDLQISTGDEYKVGVWNAAGTELVSASIDSNQQAGNDDSQKSRDYFFDETATITSGSVFYIGFEHTGDNLTPQYAQVVHADALRSWPGGAAFYAGTWNGSAWTDDATSRPCMNLILSSLHGAGGGGSSTPINSIGVIG